MITFPNSIFATLRYRVGRFFQSAPLADTVTITDTTPVFIASKSAADSVILLDVPTISTSVVYTDDVSLADAISLLFSGGLNVSNTVTVADSGLLLIQDYCDFSYFEADYVGTSSAF